MTAPSGSASGSPAVGYLRVIREHWLVIALTVAVCVLAAGASLELMPKRYTAHADVLVSPISGADDNFVGIGVLRDTAIDPSSNVLTIARLVESSATAELVRQRYRPRSSVRMLLNDVNAAPLSQTNIVAISGTGASPGAAAGIANAFARAIVDRRTAAFQLDLRRVVGRLQLQADALRTQDAAAAELAALQGRLAVLRPLLGQPDPTVRIANSAVVPTRASSPRPALTLAISLIAGVFLGVAFAFAREFTSGKIRREEDLLEQRLPVLARVPKMPLAITNGFLAGRKNLPAQAWEAYRTLRANLLAPGASSRPRSILITSASAGEGKTITAVSLAVTLAAQGMRVILMDGDFRRPMIASTFGVAAPRDGFGDLFGRGAIEKSLISAGGAHGNLRLALPTLRDPRQIDQLDADRVRGLLERLGAAADVVVVDSAPLTEISDPLALADAVDAVLIAVRLGHTRRDQLEEARRLLAQHGSPPTGFVVTTKHRSAHVPSYGSTMPRAVPHGPGIAGVVAADPGLQAGPSSVSQAMPSPPR